MTIHSNEPRRNGHVIVSMEIAALNKGKKRVYDTQTSTKEYNNACRVFYTGQEKNPVSVAALSIWLVR